MKSTDVCQQVKKPTFIMLSTTQQKNNMLSRYTKLRFLYSRTEIDMSKESLDLGEATAQAILERW